MEELVGIEEMLVVAEIDFVGLEEMVEVGFGTGCFQEQEASYLDFQ